MTEHNSPNRYFGVRIQSATIGIALGVVIVLSALKVQSSWESHRSLKRISPSSVEFPAFYLRRTTPNQPGTQAGKSGPNWTPAIGAANGASDTEVPFLPKDIFDRIYPDDTPAPFVPPPISSWQGPDPRYIQGTFVRPPVSSLESAFTPPPASTQDVYKLVARVRNNAKQFTLAGVGLNVDFTDCGGGNAQELFTPPSFEERRDDWVPG
jgi:hypothetical protein